jgi:ATP-dependent Clp protease protease subunit
MIEIKARGNKEAEILLYDDIGDDFFGGISAKAFADELRSLGALTAIDLRINSMGGSVFDGVAMHTLLVDNAAKVRVHIDGMAASIASMVAMAGDEITIAENAFMMIHKPWVTVIGDADEHRAMADRLDKVEGAIAKSYMRHTDKPMDEILEAMAVETWFDADEAVAFGLAANVAAASAIAAQGDFSKFHYRHVPEACRTPETPKRDGQQLNFAHMQQALRSQNL